MPRTFAQADTARIRIYGAGSWRQGIVRKVLLLGQKSLYGNITFWVFGE